MMEPDCEERHSLSLDTAFDGHASARDVEPPVRPVG